MGMRSVIKYVLMVQPFHMRQQLSNNCKFATSSSYFIISNTVNWNLFDPRPRIWKQTINLLPELNCYWWLLSSLQFWGWFDVLGILLSECNWSYLDYIFNRFWHLWGVETGSELLRWIVRLWANYYIVINKKIIDDTIQWSRSSMIKD